MRVQRLDLGADVVHVPTRDILVIHPDLDYWESIGAVQGTLPHLHPDVVISLVEQVTPRPKPDCRRIRRRVWIAVRVAAASLVTFFITTQFVPGPAPANATGPFGEAFAEQMEALGLECDGGGVKYRTCVNPDGDVTEVRGFAKPNSNLYMLDHPDGSTNFVLIFHDDESAEAYRERHPDTTMTGRVAIW